MLAPSLSATLCPTKAFSEYLVETILAFVEALGHNVVMLHSDQEQLLKAMQSRRVKRTLVRHGPRASHQSQGKIENANRVINGVCRTMWLSRENLLQEKLPSDSILIAWQRWSHGIWAGKAPMTDEYIILTECGEAKLIVSVSFGDAAVCRWRRQSCPNGEGHLCWLGAASSAAYPINFPNSTVKNHTLISMTLNLSNPNRVQTSKVKHSLNKQEKITILDKLKWNRAMTTIKQTSDMTNDKSTRRLQSQKDTPHLSSLDRLERFRNRTETSKGLNITLRANMTNMTPPPIIPKIDRLVSKEPAPEEETPVT